MREFRLGIHIGSGRIDDGGRSGPCYIHAQAGRFYCNLPIPRLVWPWIEKRDSPHGVWFQTYERRYGWYVFGNHFNVYLGRVTGDSITEQRWSCFLPFADWRFIRHTIYNPDGTIAYEHIGRGGSSYEASKAVPKQRFSFRDYDGEMIEAQTYVEEREWRFGTGWFKWLSAFRRPRIRRSMNIGFSAEVGPKKGSWKGGTRGHGIDLRTPDETQTQAFVRYCLQNNLTFIERINRDVA